MDTSTWIEQDIRNLRAGDLFMDFTDRSLAVYKALEDARTVDETLDGGCKKRGTECRAQEVRDHAGRPVDGGRIIPFFESQTAGPYRLRMYGPPAQAMREAC